MKIFHLPDLGEGLAEAEIREWYVKVGDHVSVDQPLLSMETAKAVVDVPSPYAGKIIKLFGQNGEMIPTHAPLIEFECEDRSPEKDRGSVVGALPESETIMDEGDVIVGLPTKTATTIKAMPAVRMLAKQLQVDLASVIPTGKDGQILAEDIKRMLANVSDEKAEPLHGARLFMAKAMAQSHEEVVNVTIIEDADITHLSQDSDITYCVMQAMVAGIKAEPSLNAWFDGKTMSCSIKDKINIGLAVDTKEGLFVPVVKDVANKNQAEVRADINRFKEAAKDRSFTPEDFTQGTITLSNFGVFAGRYATVVIVPPMVAILGCGKIRSTVLPIDNKIEIRRVMPLSLSFDHRAITGGEATRFLSVVVKTLENM
jgi:pyruvate dehydrogenase E2 component (dihydrolipoamide acetyltransferase)